MHRKLEKMYASCSVVSLPQPKWAIKSKKDEVDAVLGRAFQKAMMMCRQLHTRGAVILAEFEVGIPGSTIFA